MPLRVRILSLVIDIPPFDFAVQLGIAVRAQSGPSYLAQSIGSLLSVSQEFKLCCEAARQN